MSTVRALRYAAGDSATMLRRQLRRMRRYPSLTLTLIGLPVVFLLLFVYVFGATLGDGLGGAPGGREAYVDYVTPGVLLMAVAGAAQVAALGVAQDLTEGIIARFRTMAIWRPSILAGHVIGNLVQTLIALAAVLGVALAIGFRPTAGAVEWGAALGLLVLLTLAVIWLSVALGLSARTVESAGNAPMPLMLLPFFGSGFVPADSMPAPLRWFAEYQPFTPVIETLRGLLLGTAVGANGLQALAWCIGITLIGCLWSIRLFARDPSRTR